MARAEDRILLPVEDGTLPWTQSCFVCGESNPHGLRLRSRVEDGVVVLRYTTREADRGYLHIVHGGIGMTLLDEVMTWAAIVAAHRVCVAAELTVRLKLPVSVGEMLTVHGWVSEQRSRIVMTGGAIMNGDGNEVMSASGKYVPMPPDQVTLCSKDFVASSETIDISAIFAAAKRAIRQE